mmetsp:Transcript_13485/g.29755  ORF Transcript_13485/g.29755 Transcript_13485/m.29755 type:complete len:497 (-) Transcript_13485:202-1692(-)
MEHLAQLVVVRNEVILQIVGWPISDAGLVDQLVGAPSGRRSWPSSLISGLPVAGLLTPGIAGLLLVLALARLQFVIMFPLLAGGLLISQGAGVLRATRLASGLVVGLHLGGQILIDHDLPANRHGLGQNVGVVVGLRDLHLARLGQDLFEEGLRRRQLELGVQKALVLHGLKEGVLGLREGLGIWLGCQLLSMRQPLRGGEALALLGRGSVDDALAARRQSIVDQTLILQVGNHLLRLECVIAVASSSKDFAEGVTLLLVVARQALKPIGNPLGTFLSRGGLKRDEVLDLSGLRLGRGGGLSWLRGCGGGGGAYFLSHGLVEKGLAVALAASDDLAASLRRLANAVLLGALGQPALAGNDLVGEGAGVLGALVVHLGGMSLRSGRDVVIRLDFLLDDLRGRGRLLQRLGGLLGDLARDDVVAGLGGLELLLGDDKVGLDGAEGLLLGLDFRDLLVGLLGNFGKGGSVGRHDVFGCFVVFLLCLFVVFVCYEQLLRS